MAYDIGKVEEQYFREMRSIPLVTREEEVEIARKWRDEGNLRARDKLVEVNLRYAAKFAFQYSKYGLPMSDLIQEANVGLVKATEKFDPERGYKFISYAEWWMKAYIHEYIYKNWGLVQMKTVQHRYRVFTALMSPRKYGKLSDAEIAEKFDTKKGVVADVRRWMRERGEISLEGDCSDDEEGLSMKDTIADDSVGQEQELCDLDKVQFYRRKIDAVVESIRNDGGKQVDREALILSKRLLCSEDDAETLQNLGDDLGITKERVRQLEAALKKKIKMRLPEDVRLEFLDIDYDPRERAAEDALEASMVDALADIAEVISLDEARDEKLSLAQIADEFPMRKSSTATVQS